MLSKKSKSNDNSEKVEQESLKKDSCMFLNNLSINPIRKPQIFFSIDGIQPP